MSLMCSILSCRQLEVLKTPSPLLYAYRVYVVDNQHETAKLGGVEMRLLFLFKKRIGYY